MNEKQCSLQMQILEPNLRLFDVLTVSIGPGDGESWSPEFYGHFPGFRTLYYNKLAKIHVLCVLNGVPTTLDS